MSTNPFLWDLYFKIVNFMSYRGSQEKFEQGAIMEINFDCDSWIDISKENAKLVSYELPNE